MANFQWVPFDFTALKTEEQDNMFLRWCRSVMSCLVSYNAGGMLKFEPKGDTGPATEKVIQGAQVWITYKGKPLLYNLLVPFNDMLANEKVNSTSSTLRNDPSWYAGDLVSRALDKELFPPPPETYGLQPRPADPDIVV